MNYTKKLTLCSATIASLAFTVTSAHAAVTIVPAFSGSSTEVSNATDQAYSGDQSGSDLIEGLTATTTSGWTIANGADPAELNDGIYGAFPGNTDAEGAWTDVGAVVEYNLGANALGYDITGIQSIASWTGAGFGNQVWTVEVKPVDGSYATLASVDYTPFNNTSGATKVNLTGLNATGIESIRFTAGSTSGNSFGDDFVFREIDVFGIATVPEPSAAALLGLGGLAFLSRRKRN